MHRGRVNLLVLTTDFLLVMRPQNFSIGKQGLKLDQSVILLERLSDIFEYKVLMSPELHLGAKKDKTAQGSLVQSGFFLVVVATVDMPTGAAAAREMQEVDVATTHVSVHADYQGLPEQHITPDGEAYRLGDSFARDDGHFASSATQVREAGYSVRSNTAGQVIENQSLTSITSKLHKNFKVTEFYSEIADFGYLKVGKVNGQNLTRDSLLVQMFRSADVSHTSTTVAGEPNDGEDGPPEQIQIHLQNPQRLYRKLYRLATHAKRRTVVYSERFDVLDRVFQLIDKAVPEAKENAMVLNQLRREIHHANASGGKAGRKKR